MAGGVADAERYPWDPPDGPATQGADAVVVRTNVREAQLDGPSPVAMYPLGASRPFGLRELAGNVWEWTGSWYDEEGQVKVLRGGSWFSALDNARCGTRSGGTLGYSELSFGCRLVSPIGSGF